MTRYDATRRHALAAAGARLACGPSLAMLRAQRSPASALAALGAALAATRALAAEAAAAPRVATPQPFELDYDGYLDTMRIARGHLSFAPSAGGYKLSLRVDSLFAHLAYESEGTVDASGLHPRRYAESRRIGPRQPRERTVAFRREGEPATDAGGADVLVVPRGTQDRLSVIVQVSLIARAETQRFVEGSRWTMPYGGFERVDRLQLVVGAVETVDTASGTARAQRVHKIVDDPASTPLDFWLATEGARQPVVLRFEDDGRVLRFAMR